MDHLVGGTVDVTTLAGVLFDTTVGSAEVTSPGLSAVFGETTISFERYLYVLLDVYDQLAKQATAFRDPPQFI